MVGTGAISVDSGAIAWERKESAIAVKSVKKRAIATFVVRQHKFVEMAGIAKQCMGCQWYITGTIFIPIQRYGI